MTGCFLGQMLVNIPYMEHMGYLTAMWGEKTPRSRPLSKNTAISYLRLTCFEIAPTKWSTLVQHGTHMFAVSVVQLWFTFEFDMVKTWGNLVNFRSKKGLRYQTWLVYKKNRPSVELVAAWGCFSHVLAMFSPFTPMIK